MCCTGRCLRIEDGIDWVVALCAELNTPALSTWGVTESDLRGVAEKAAKASSMQTNPLPLTEKELVAVVRPSSAKYNRGFNTSDSDGGA